MGYLNSGKDRSLGAHLLVQIHAADQKARRSRLLDCAVDLDQRCVQLDAGEIHRFSSPWVGRSPHFWDSQGNWASRAAMAAAVVSARGGGGGTAGGGAGTAVRRRARRLRAVARP